MSNDGKKITVIMPVYNEEKTLDEILGRVLKQDCVKKLIAIDDSTDNSTEILRRRAKKDKRVKIIHNKKPGGKGGALIKGIKEVKEGLLLIQDSDLEYFPEDYPDLLNASGKNMVVFGSRSLSKKKDSVSQYKIARLANVVMSGTFSILFRQRITDLYTCYKLFDRKMIDPEKLKEKGFLIEPEMAIQMIRAGYKVVEVPIRYKGRSFEEGKKITASDGIKGLLYIISKGLKYSLNIKDD